jgi:hypothetical protein
LEPEEQKIVFKTLNGDREIPKKFLPALASFMNNVYFQRAWIVQEVTLAQDVLFQYGTSSCLDPKDKVFSMLEIYRLFTGHSQLLIEPDYRQPVEDIMIDVARNVILRIKDLSVLAFTAQHRWRGTSLLPSWVPDWRDGIPFQQLRHHVLPLASSGPGGVDFEDGGRTLRAHGFEIDKIDHAVDLDFSGKHAWVKSIMTYLEVDTCASNQHTCGTKAMWLALLFLVSPNRFESYHSKRESPEKTAPSGPLHSTNFPPRDRNARSHLAETFWAWLKAETDPTQLRCSEVKTNLRNEWLYATEHGSFVVAPATAEPGDVIVAFPETFPFFVLRNIGAYHFVIGVA